MARQKILHANTIINIILLDMIYFKLQNKRLKMPNKEILNIIFEAAKRQTFPQFSAIFNNLFNNFINLGERSSHDASPFNIQTELYKNRASEKVKPSSSDSCHRFSTSGAFFSSEFEITTFSHESNCPVHSLTEADKLQLNIELRRAVVSIENEEFHKVNFYRLREIMDTLNISIEHLPEGIQDFMNLVYGDYDTSTSDEKILEILGLHSSTQSKIRDIEEEEYESDLHGALPDPETTEEW
jgi:hypothetical protein